MELIKIQIINNTPVIDSRIVAEELGNDHASIIRLINKHLSIIEENFGRVGFEIIPLKTKGGKQDARIAHLTEDQAIFIGTLSKNSKQAVQYKTRLVQAFSAERKKLTPAPVQLSPMEMLEMQFKLHKEQSNRIDFIENKVLQIEAKAKTQPDDYYAIAGYASLIRKPVNITDASTIGKKASAICNRMGFVMGTVPDPRFGRVRTYPKQVLSTVFEDYFK
jgi:phage regulator Rha-like protein